MEHNYSVTEEAPVRLERIGGVSLNHEVSGEHTLPDYLPPIRRMISLRVSVLPEGQFLTPAGNGTGLELAGTVTYSLVYTDDEGKLCSASLTADYTSSTQLSGNVDDVRLTTMAENNTCRVLAPRKVGLRSRLVTAVEGWRTVSLEEELGGISVADRIALERLPVTYSASTVLHGEGKGLREEGVLATTGEPLRPVLCDGCVTVRSARAVNDGVVVRGAVSVSCLAVSESGGASDMPVSWEKTEEFEETVEIPGCREGDSVTAHGRSVALLLNNDEAADGSREISYELTFDLSADAVRNRTLTATADLYSTARALSCTYRTGDSLSVEKVVMGSLTLSEDVPFNKGSADSACVNTAVRATVERQEWKDGKLILSGSAVFSTVMRAGDGELSGEEYAVPFRYTVDSRAQRGYARVTCSCGPAHGRVDGETIRLGTELYFAVTVFDARTLTAVEAVTVGEPYPEEDRECLRVYYPGKGETLWQVGKRYHKSCRELAEANGLSGDGAESLGEGKRLIV